ncbi:polyprenyl synthetase family protein [Streptomyces sp. NPDC017979]|uniref:polyprenyl synthetase family protein n=1 Tax=Streptomyces sp. NPDC017979 TaxID=3365024 RepID=UPI003794912C
MHSGTAAGTPPCSGLPAEYRAAVEAHLAAFLDAKERSGTAGGPVPEDVPALLREFIGAGGKRIRPLLCIAGWQAGGGTGLPGEVVGTAAALEMFHAFALIHDDIMDGSVTRRGRTTVHQMLADRLGAALDPDQAEQLGVSAAILVGDLALTWSDELLYTDLTPHRLAAVLPLVMAMRAETVHGQYLDITSARRPSTDASLALRIARYKTAAYTVERPLHIGAALAGAQPELLAGLSAYALPAGEAFQLADDLLGVFGDPQTTGKPNLDDLRGGKHTVLVALAREHATPEQRDTLDALLGRPGLGPQDATRLRRILVATGARAEVEHLITERRNRALTALNALALPTPLADALSRLTLGSAAHPA